jgi:hypothetical protein
MAIQRVKQRVRIMRDIIMTNTRPSTRYLLVYLLALLAAYLVLLLFKALDAPTRVEYFILDGHYVFGTASFPTYTIAEIVAFGPVMAAVMTWCFRKTLASWSDAGLMPARKASVLGMLFAVSIAMLNAGLLVNRLFNVVSAQAKYFFDTVHEGYANYVFAYFLDEIVGHHLMNAGFVLYYVVMAVAAPQDSIPLSRPEHALNGGERVLVLVSSAVHAVLFSIENLEGQSMVFSLVLMGATACVILLVTMARRNKLAFLNRPFFFFIAVQLVVMLVFAVIWGIALGVKPYYPFFYEPSELSTP